MHLSWSTNLERRLKRLLLAAAAPGSADAAEWRRKFASVQCWPAGSRLELSLTLYSLAERFYPERYLRFLKLRMPWLVGISHADPYARLEVTDRPPARLTPVWGPFRSRAAAQQYEAEVTGLFQIRRCSDILAPSPDHPGCVYGEMNQCLRPCQQAVSLSEYQAEAARVGDFLGTNGRSAIASLSSARDRACEEAAFEHAALVHKRIERMESAAQLRDPVIAELGSFNGVALTASLQPGQCVLWPMLAGFWQEPLTFSPLEKPAASRSLDSTLRELLASALAAPRSDGKRNEELALFARWYYSSWRDGHWFPFASLPSLNYRKLVREISKLVAPPVLR